MSSGEIVAITMGDPGGIGPEIIDKALADPELLRNLRPLVIGTPEAFKRLTSGGFTPAVVKSDDLNLKPGRVHFLNIEKDAKALLRKYDKPYIPGTFDIGKISPTNAALSLASIQSAVTLALSGKVKAIVTAPVNKTAIRLLDPTFQGHTELLAEASGVSRYAMMFVGPRFHVTLVTVHVPLKEVSGCLSQSLIVEKIALTDHFLKNELGIERPKIAVCALNPHGEETGTEEREMIAPAVEEARNAGANVTGPLPADQLFYEAYNGRYDALISMYHDQGLAPFKMTAFHDGVNVTLGLPFIRTSPDHGTAFDIAFQNKADASSMKSSISLAARLIHRKGKQKA